MQVLSHSKFGVAIMTDEKAPPIPPDWRVRLIENINAKVQNGGVCRECGEKQIVVADDLVSPVIYQGGLVLGGSAYPQGMLICNNCGNTRFFNAVILGVVPPKAT